MISESEYMHHVSILSNIYKAIHNTEMVRVTGRVIPLYTAKFRKSIRTESTDIPYNSHVTQIFQWFAHQNATQIFLSQEKGNSSSQVPWEKVDIFVPDSIVYNPSKI